MYLLCLYETYFSTRLNKPQFHQEQRFVKGIYQVNQGEEKLA